MEDCRVAVIADWDADGVVGAALIYFAQEKRGIFPVEKKEKVCLIPAGPRSIIEEVGDKCWERVVIVDIPLTQEVETVIANLKEKCNAKIYYFDHHSSTLSKMAELEEKYGVFGVVGRSSSAVIIKRFLEGMGLKLTQRMRDFVAAVAVLEGGRRHVKEEVSKKLVTLAASISKMLNQTRNKEAWVKYVKWIANPLPFEDPGIKLRLDEKVNLVEAGVELSEQADKETKDVALQLAMSAVNLGYLKFIDARDKWKKRGASALASAIFKIVNMPVALLVEKSDGSRLLIIRSGHGEAMDLIEILYNQGVVVDTGGHGNIAVARVEDTVTVAELKKSLRRAVVELIRKRSSRYIDSF
ncbi:MAG: phosphoesterase [Desulfurococcales archaeon]|nr:phosphoesterase [Desulfurococcales archaeon]MCE4629126.1 phosphoesterase [Desulfurococcales archaeon]